MKVAPFLAAVLFCSLSAHAGPKATPDERRDAEDGDPDHGFASNAVTDWAADDRASGDSA